MKLPSLPKPSKRFAIMSALALAIATIIFLVVVPHYASQEGPATTATTATTAEPAAAPAQKPAGEAASEPSGEDAPAEKEVEAPAE